MKPVALATLLLLAASPVWAAQAADGPGWLNLVLLLIVMGLLLVGAWAARKYGPVAGVRKNLGVELLGRVPLNQKSGLALVRAGNQVMVLGLTAERISLLKEMPLSEFKESLEQDAQAGQP
ncbi:MAG: Flagellar biosynthesis protein, FliO [Deltaproteobacteria bacterium ADurb.Bin510]|nr:MAG: Flagellar biosynthesis protein, FliO [Deltaproteobacteria bacterium ADurb.Bin510]